MAGHLIKIDEEIVTSAVASVTLGGLIGIVLMMCIWLSIIMYPVTDAQILELELLKWNT